MTFSKRDPAAPAGFFQAEAAGLRWLAAAAVAGGVPVAEPLAVAQQAITLGRLHQVPPTPQAAEQFGRRLALTHRSGGRRHGCPPDGWTGPGFIGPLPMTYRPEADAADPAADPAQGWGAFFADLRIAPYTRAARDAGALDAAGAAVLDRICARLADGDGELVGPAEPVARLHGDLWSGNVLWTADGVRLIDPAAHGGHRESDLAMLALFGLPLLDRVLACYQQEWPLAAGWQSRLRVHQLFPLLVHAVLFGAGYAAEAVRAARSL
jgi:fructosamine-3-kinase